MAAAEPIRKCHYIAIADLKPKYRETRNGIARIKAYTRALEVTAEKIGGGCFVNIQVESKEGNIIQFTVTADSRIRANNVTQHIQGEFCDVSAQAKYDSDDRYLPSHQVKGIKGPREAQKKLSEASQDLLQGENHHVLLTEEALRKHDIKHMTGPCELRQFGCAPCDHFWWRIVPVSKMVSRCRQCQIRYDALPRQKEFGIGRFQCTKPTCKRIFFAKCVAMDRLRCRKCKTLVKHPHIHPRWRKPKYLPRSRRGRPRQGQSLNPSAAPFVPRSQDRREPSFEPVSTLQGRMNQMSLSSRPDSAGYYQYSASSQSQLSQEGIPQMAPRTPANKPKVKNPSRVHNSSGSTMSTFITQMDEGEFDEVPLDYDSDDPDEGVGVCRFECDCGNKYTVLCEMTDTAGCYECRRDNPPMGWAPPRNIDAETSNRHSCSKCRGQPGCPNLLAVASMI